MTSELNESPSEPPAEMSVQMEGKKRGFLRGCLIAFLVMAVLFVLFLMFLSSLGRMPPSGGAAICRSSLTQAYGSMRWFIKDHLEEGDEIPPEWTIPVLIREWHYDWKAFFCPAPGLTYRDPYLAFLVPASILLNPAEQEPVPILMCRPGVHGKYGTPVLYSDGTVRSLTTEEAEKLAAEQSPVPLEINFEAMEEDARMQALIPHDCGGEQR